MLHALTFDVEDYFHVHAFAEAISRDSWDAIPTRVVDSTRRILRLLGKQNTRATFFVLGWVAERHPELVREIAGAGHELASHGFAHEAVDTLTREQFRDDVARSLEAIQLACPGSLVRGYRAPSFSINERTPWAFEELAKLGFTYDSSISPVTFHDRYGMPAAPRGAHAIEGNLLEIPVSTIRLLGCNWPVAGGGYFRLAPLPFTRWAMQRLEREQMPTVVYLHPWEFDPEQPRVAASRRSRFRHYINLGRTEARLRRLLEQFSFGTLESVFRHGPNQSTVAEARDTLPAR